MTNKDTKLTPLLYYIGTQVTETTYTGQPATYLLRPL